jgi:hypothetical protein
MTFPSNQVTADHSPSIIFGKSTQHDKNNPSPHDYNVDNATIPSENSGNTQAKKSPMLYA